MGHPFDAVDRFIDRIAKGILGDPYDPGRLREFRLRCRLVAQLACTGPGPLRVEGESLPEREDLLQDLDRQASRFLDYAEPMVDGFRQLQEYLRVGEEYPLADPPKADLFERWLAAHRTAAPPRIDSLVRYLSFEMGDAEALRALRLAIEPARRRPARGWAEMVDREADLVDLVEWIADAVRDLRLRVRDGLASLPHRPPSADGDLSRAWPDDERNRWLYERCCDGIPHKAIRTELEKLIRSGEHPGWDLIGTDQGIRDAARRYADRHGRPQPPARQSRRTRSAESTEFT